GHYPKLHPMFVSDAIMVDVHATVAWLRHHADTALRALGERLHADVGSVSKVEMVTSMALIYMVLFPSISTFETPPSRSPPAPRGPGAPPLPRLGPCCSSTASRTPASPRAVPDRFTSGPRSCRWRSNGRTKPCTRADYGSSTSTAVSSAV